MAPKAVGKAKPKEAAKAKPKPKAKGKASPEVAKVKEQILASFEKADTDGNGTISKSEITSMLSQLGMKLAEAELMYDQVDSNDDGDIDFREFVEWVFGGEHLEGIVDASVLDNLMCSVGHELKPFSMKTAGRTCPSCGEAIEVGHKAVQCKLCGDTCWCIHCAVNLDFVAKELQRTAGLKAIANRFELWDADHSGNISKDEIKQVLERTGVSHLVVDSIIGSVDFDHDDGISMGEFSSWLVKSAMPEGIKRCPGNCGYRVTWHATHCCGTCSENNGQHGKKCDRKDVVQVCRSNTGSLYDQDQDDMRMFQQWLRSHSKDQCIPAVALPTDAMHPDRAQPGRLLLKQVLENRTTDTPIGRTAEEIVLPTFFDSIPRKHVEILSFQKVVQSELLDNFLEKAIQNAGSIELTFHGTSPATVDAICANGLRSGVSKGGSRALHGIGAYVGTHAGVAHSYALPSYPPCEVPDCRFMFCVLVCVGTEVVTGKLGSRATLTGVDDVKNPMMYIMVEDDRMIVTHLIRYKTISPARVSCADFGNQLKDAIERSGHRVQVDGVR